MKACREIIELLAASNGIHFDAAIVEISGPAPYAQIGRVLLDEPSKADPLHASANDITPGLNRNTMGHGVIVRSELLKSTFHVQDRCYLR